jgi:hypothetical protein
LITASGPLFAQSVLKTPRRVPQILPLDDSDAGFTPIFDGTTLDGWDGDTAYWRAEDGELIGEVTAANLLKHNSFIIWRGGKPKNFELKAEYRISDFGNSGINYRSVEIRGNHWVLRGPQADIDGQNVYTGQNYEEGGRTVLARRGDVIHILNGHIMSEVIDDDRVNRRFRGLIGVQVHVGPPMKVEYRHILLRTLN